MRGEQPPVMRQSWKSIEGTQSGLLSHLGEVITVLHLGTPLYVYAIYLQTGSATVSLCTQLGS